MNYPELQDEIENVHLVTVVPFLGCNLGDVETCLVAEACPFMIPARSFFQNIFRWHWGMGPSYKIERMGGTGDGSH